MTTPNLSIPHVLVSQSQKEVTVNNALNALDRAIAGRFVQAVTTASITISAANSAHAIIELTGVLTANATITMPATIKTWVFLDKTDRTVNNFTITVKKAGGVTVGALITDKVTTLVCDGTEIYK